MRRAFEQVEADFVFMLDADYTYPAAYIPDMLGILHQGCDVAIGSRLKGEGEKGAMTCLNTIRNHLLTLMTNMLYLTRISDLCTGYWDLKGNIIPRLRLSATGFNFEAELFTQIVKSGYSIGEVPIYYRRRPTPTKLSSIKDGLTIGWTLLSRRLK